MFISNGLVVEDLGAEDEWRNKFEGNTRKGLANSLCLYTTNTQILILITELNRYVQHEMSICVVSPKEWRLGGGWVSL